MQNKNAYYENCKIPAALKEFAVRRSISVPARPPTCAAYREHR
jgi:hypothetical protein